MVSRVLKNELREHMRNVRSSSEEDNKDVIATFFGRFLQDPHFWQSSPSISTTFDVKQRLQERFPSCLTVGEVRTSHDTHTTHDTRHGTQHSLGLRRDVLMISKCPAGT